MASPAPQTSPTPPNPPPPIETPTTPPPKKPATPKRASASAPKPPGLSPLTPKTLPAYLSALDMLYELCKYDFRNYWASNTFEPARYDAMLFWLEKSLDSFRVLNTTVLLLTNGDALYQAQKWADESNWGSETSGRLGIRRQVYSPIWVVAAAAIDELQDKVAEIERWLRGTATGNWWHVGKYAAIGYVKTESTIVYGGVPMVRSSAGRARS